MITMLHSKLSIPENVSPENLLARFHTFFYHFYTWKKWFMGNNFCLKWWAINLFYFIGAFHRTLTDHLVCVCVLLFCSIICWILPSMSSLHLLLMWKMGIWCWRLDLVPGPWRMFLLMLVLLCWPLKRLDHFVK